MISFRLLNGFIAKVISTIDIPELVQTTLPRGEFRQIRAELIQSCASKMVAVIKYIKE